MSAPELSAEEAAIVARFEAAEYPAEVAYVDDIRSGAFNEGVLAGMKLAREER